MDQPLIRAEALLARESIWKAGRDESVLVQVEYLHATPKEWWGSPKSADPSWRVEMVGKDQLFIHRITTTL
jgi:hypothetical protein